MTISRFGASCFAIFTISILMGVFSVAYAGEARSCEGMFVATTDGVLERKIARLEESYRLTTEAMERAIHQAYTYELRDPVLSPVLRYIELNRLQGELLHREIERLNALVAAKGAASIDDLMDRRFQLQVEIGNQKFVPQDVIKSMLELSREDVLASHDTSHPATRGGRLLAFKKWKKLTEEHPFFATLNAGDLEAIGMHWREARTPLAVISMFGFLTTAAPPSLPLRLRDLNEVETALMYLGASPTN